MLYKLFTGSEGIVTYFFIIATVSCTYSEEMEKRNRYLTLFVSTLLFGLIFKPIEIVYSSYYFYLIFTTFCALLYSFLFLRRQFLVASAMVAYLMYEVILTKSALSCILNIVNGDPDSETYQFFLVFFLFSCFLLFSIFFQKHKINSRTKLPLQYWVTFFVAPFFLIVCSEWFSQHYARNRNSDALIPYLALTFALLLTYYLSYLLIHNYEELMESSFLKQKFELQTDYLRQSSSMIHQVRKERHELKNNYFYLQSLVKEKKYDDLEQFLNQEIEHKFELMEEFHTGNRLVDYILTQKVNEARNAGIHVVTNVLLPETLNIQEQDLCALLLNLIDNAIEASKKEEQGDIHISIGIAKKYLSVQIKNKSSEDILVHNPTLKTIKSDSIYHGFGLQIIRQIVQKYNGIFDTSMKSGYFCASVMLALK